MRLQGPPDMNIKFKAVSTDDLNVLADISSRILRDINELRLEINSIMSSIITQAEIDSTQHAEVGMNLILLDDAGILLVTKSLIIITQSIFHVHAQIKSRYLHVYVTVNR